jgi:hypothetical protein
MRKGDLLIKAASDIQRIINSISSRSYATQKAASMVADGAINDADQENLSNLFAGRSQEEINLASQAIGLATGKSHSGWGVADETSSSGGDSFDPDNRYARLDAIIMSGGQF